MTNVSEHTASGSEATLTLTEFLLARIAEDEANNGCNGEGEYRTCWERSERIERECEAKRRIVEEFSARHDDDGLMLGPPILRQKEWSGLRLAARLLALPYADHPDYREEWRG